MRFRTFAGVALTVFALPAAHALAADPPKQTVTKVIAVGDIVAGPRDGSQKLVKVVTEMVRPYSWDGNGGAGKIEFFDVGNSVVVSNSEDAVKEVEALIGALRRLGGVNQLKPALAAVASSDSVPQCPVAPPAPCALPVPAPVCASECWAPPTALDRMRELAAAHARTGARASYVVKLRNVAAADVARAIHKHFADRATGCTVIAEPVSNTLVASGEPEHLRRALDLAAALDVAPPQAVVSATVVSVPSSFLDTAGLSTEKGATAWTLSARETHMFGGLLRAEKAHGKTEVLARPQIQVCDKQTGHVRVGQDVVLASATETKVEGTTTVAVEKPVSRFVGLNLKVTPKFAPCGESIALAVESDFSQVAPGLGIDLGNGKHAMGINAASVRATAILKKGESFVLATHADKGTVTLVVLAPAPVQPACPGWFTK